jgi:P27 family predicted phage terminase small subunit
MRGRKPVPTALKVLRGNPGQRRLNTDEPVPPALDADPMPAELTDANAQDEWQRIAPGLVACGQVTMADRTLLVAYCLKYGQWIQLERNAKRSPVDYRAIRCANQTLDLLIRTASELGITPASRTRVSRTPVQPVSKWADALP